MSVYQASDPWERDQESANPRRKPGYRPTHDDMLGRYVKFLVWQTMDRRAAYTAVGLGCLLYTYRPGEICMLAEDLFDDSNIRRIKRWLTDRMTSRFRNAPIFSDDYHTFRTRPPTEHDRSVVHNALVAFTPWACRHSPPQPSQVPILEAYFGRSSSQSELDRIRVLIDPVHAGLPRIVREYNHGLPRQSDSRLADPDHKLRVPTPARG
jgi:hypothetical protein